MYVSTEQLMRHLQVTQRRLDSLHRQNHLRREPASAHYQTVNVDTFLASISYNFPHPPTWHDIETGRFVPITTEQAKNMYGIDRSGLQTLRLRFHTPYINLGVRSYIVTRYCRRTLDAHFGVTGAQAAKVHVTKAAFVARCLGYTGVGALSSLAGLTVMRTKDARSYVANDAYRHYARQHLPEWVEVDDWIDSCEVVGNPLVPLAEAAAHCGLSSEAMIEELRNRRGIFITRVSPGGTEVMVSTAWLEAQLRLNQPVRQKELAAFFDVDSTTVRRWQQNQLIRCMGHGHHHAGDEDPWLWRSCWLAYLYQHCRPEEQTAMWHFWASRFAVAKPPSLYTSGSISKRFGVTDTTVFKWAGAGKLLVVRTPSGTIRCPGAWLRRFNASQ